MDFNVLILTKLNVIYNHMVLKDAHDAGLIPDDMWINYLTEQTRIISRVEDRENCSSLCSTCRHHWSNSDKCDRCINNDEWEGKDGNETEGSMV